MTFSYSKEWNLTGYTSIENPFILQYLPEADGIAVKVYVYGLFLCNNSSDISLEAFASDLKITTDEVIDCFNYWEEFGLVCITSKEPFSIQYLPVKNGYSKQRKNTEKYAGFSSAVQALITTRMISTSEFSEYFNIMDVYSIKPEAMLMIIKYCIDKKGDTINYRYISKVAKDFGSRGINTVNKVEKELENYILNTAEIEKILSALALKRQPDLDDLNLLNKWTNELGFEMDNILFTARKMKKSSMKKLDEHLLDLYSTKSFSKEEIENHLVKKEYAYNLALKITKALSLYYGVLDTVVDNYVAKWIDLGFLEDSLLFVANYLFKANKNTLQDMDDEVNALFNKGLISLNSITEYFVKLSENDNFIKSLLDILSISRRPTDWDRNNLKTWREWNFSDEMIIEACRLSIGKSNPFAYMNSILGNWKNKEIFSPNMIDAKSTTNSFVQKPINDNVLEKINAKYQVLRTNAEIKAQENLKKALSNKEFNDIYYQINGMEKDLAFAEFKKDAKLLKELEDKKALLLSRQEELLNSMNLSLDSLTPTYRCKKCKDTGLVDGERCDCFYEVLSEIV
ncbi:MAG: hypothetical protein E7342_03175 [Clostridiales bacterium]|nr:hypothetical protein [Clostridiales bacterium]